MDRARITLALAVLAAACKDDPPAQGDETTGTTGAGDSTTQGLGGSTNATTTPPPDPTTGDPDSTTYGAGCGPDPCPEMCGDCPSTATCLASVWTCECACDSTTGSSEPCDVLDAEIDAWVAASKVPAVDCGSPDTDDDPFAWQTLHDCSVIQAMGQGLRATWTLGDGSEPFEYGVAARVGEVYELAWFERGATTLVQHSCTAITATPDCEVGVASPCLTCEGQTEVAILCDDGSTSGTSTS